MAELAVPVWLEGTLRGSGGVIFVTVGMHHQGFERLIRAMDEVAGQVDERVVMQIGASSHEPVHAEWFRFEGQARIEGLCAEARAIVAHAGAGTIITAFRYTRPLIVVPRRLEHRECIDDHQIELAQALSVMGKLVTIEEPTLQTLIGGIAKAVQLHPEWRDRSNLVAAVSGLLAADVA